LIRELARGRRRRWAYNFDGVDDFGVLGTRAIDLDSGGFDVEWEQQGARFLAGAQWVVNQADNSQAFSSREFYIRWQGNNLEIMVGGTSITIANAWAANGVFRVTQSAGVLTVLRDGVTLFSGLRTVGTARQPTVRTTLFAVEPVAGVFQAVGLNIRINGVTWRIDQPQQAIQPSDPPGNNLTLVNTNPERWSEIDA
jgi:hypothetical protein